MVLALRKEETEFDNSLRRMNADTMYEFRSKLGEG